MIVNGKSLSNLLALHDRGLVHTKHALRWCNLLRTQVTMMKPAIDWLCINGVDEAIMIDEIRALIERKWISMGYPFFMLSFYYNLFLALLLTFISCLMEYDLSTHVMSSPIPFVLTIVHVLVIVLFIVKWVQLGWDFFYFHVHWLKPSWKIPFIHFHTRLRGTACIYAVIHIIDSGSCIICLC